ncbi:MAG: hypothetical protein LUE86_05010 [Clostridiales bacterium]|nr:hypothetical protein [Clostridiales bacterium]
MSYTFTIRRDCYEEGVNFFRYRKLTIEPGVTVLTGCNGAGKSTLITLMKEELDRAGIKYTSYDNMRNGGVYAMTHYAYLNDLASVSNVFSSSEGESLIYNFGQKLMAIGKYIRAHANTDQWIFIDAVDSGLSIDNMAQVKALFQSILSGEDIPGGLIGDTYIILSTNSYEFAENARCLDVISGKTRTFRSYSTYRKYILNSAEKKQEREERTEKKREALKNRGTDRTGLWVQHG